MTRRAVFDCNVFVQAVASRRGPAAEAFARVEAGCGIELCVSDDLLTEVRSVTGRPDVRKKLRTLTDERVAQLLALIDRIAVKIADVPLVLL